MTDERRYAEGNAVVTSVSRTAEHALSKRSSIFSDCRPARGCALETQQWWS
jgi:hypothetical protein